MSHPAVAAPRRPDVVAAAVRSLAGQLPGPGRYCLAYGSHATGTNGTCSDLDVLQVTPSRPSPEQARRFQDAVIRLHHDHGLHLDTEVCFEVKLIATHDDVLAALDHVPFPSPSDPEHPLAPAVPADPAFLNSAVFQQRLILNVLTSPNVFLGGDLGVYTRHTCAADASLALLAMRIMADRRQRAGLAGFTLDEALDAVLHGPGGATGEDYLGYHPSAWLLGTLNRGLHRLIAAGIADHERSEIYRPGPGWVGTATSTADAHS
ncbi:MAG: hypothetical protein QG608_1945 [Actinomycetota bacterium]|nr:hypothetical protein [Actinomycetota bacterium]